MFVLNTAVEILLLLVQFLHDFDLILFADLHSWSTETTFARSYLAFAHFFPCRGQQKSPQRERLIFIWELFEFGSHDGMCVLDIENNDQLQDLELHSQRKLPKSQTRFCHKLVRLFIHQMRDFLEKIGQIQSILIPRRIFVMTTNCWSKSTMFFRTSLVQHFFFKVGTNLLKGPGQKRWSVITITNSNCEDAT